MWDLEATKRDLWCISKNRHANLKPTRNDNNIRNLITYCGIDFSFYLISGRARERERCSDPLPYVSFVFDRIDEIRGNFLVIRALK